MKFKQYLIEKSMSVVDALKVFDIETVPTKTELKKKFRTLAVKLHPDRNPDKDTTKDMQDLNAANDSLQRATPGSSATSKSKYSVNWDDINKKYQDLGRIIKKELLDGFNAKSFITYFKKEHDIKLKYEEKKTYPAESVKSPSFAGFTGEFYSKDRTTVILFDISATLTNIDRDGKGLSAGNEVDMSNIKFPLFITTEIFHNNKRHKLTNKNYNFTNDHSFYKDPDKLFPKTKIKKILSGTSRKGSKFSKRDMLSFFKNKVKASVSGTDVRVYLGKDREYYLWLTRGTMMKTPYWSVNGLFKKPGGSSKVKKVIRGFFEETEDMALEMEKTFEYFGIGKTEDQMIKRTEDSFASLYEWMKKKHDLT